MSDILKDSRFTKYLNDPRYKQIPKHERKVKIDKRFQSMFKDDKFKVKYTIDKRGRPINETSTENLRKYYDLESDEGSVDNESSEDETTLSNNSEGKLIKLLPSNTESVDVNFKNDKLVRGILDSKTRDKLHDLEIDYARGEGNVSSYISM